MTRKELFKRYYEITDLAYPDKFRFGRYISQEEWQKGQIGVYSKGVRKIFIAVQYLLPAISWIPMLLDKGDWIFIPLFLSLGLMISCLTDFSLIRIELLYRVYKRENVYCTLLFDMFCRKFDGFIQELQRTTKKLTTGYVMEQSIFRRYLRRGCKAICRDKAKSIRLIFHPRRVTVIINDERRIINDASLTREGLIKEIGLIIKNGRASD